MSQGNAERNQGRKVPRNTDEWFQHLIQNSPDIITVVDADGTILYQSSSMEKILGHQPEERIGKNAFESDLIHPKDRSVKNNLFTKAICSPGTSVSAEVRLRHQDGSWRCMHETIRNLLDDPHVGAIVLNDHDITEHKEAEEQLRYQALHDSLTDLPNRTLLLDRLEHALSRTPREGGPVSVLLVDLDDFKLINDSLGHAAGNTLLVEVAKRLRSCVRFGDTVARLFGDEFVILLEAPVTLDEARQAAKRIQERLQGSFKIARREVFVRCSIGIALGKSPEDQPEEILRHADLAMYMAKGKGKDQLAVYDPIIDTWAQERMDLENDLRRGVEFEEFEIHYQPIVLLRTGAIIGVEALVRWRHPDRGLLLPTQFISLAEKTGLIGSIGLWVLKESCRQLKEWQDRYPANLGSLFGLCVNLSEREIQQPDLAQKIAGVLRESGLDPRCLTLEITERTALEDAEQTIEKLRELKELDVKLALDDFGTGYCSLVYLEHSLFDILKIDRLLIHRKKEVWEECVAIVSALVSMAHALGLEVIVEGVEAEDQVAELKAMGCEMAQGFFFAKSLPSEGAEKLLAEGISWC
jgi:diguanylate cyclase (GGDEF)-like protein/PAS domain S-box-containing protein